MITTYQLSKFHGGISDNIREQSGTTFSISKHFDIFSNPGILTPYRSFEADQTISSGSDLKPYLVKEGLLGSDGKLYGLGQVVATGYTKIVSKSSPQSGNWSLPSTAEGNGTVIHGSFGEYYQILWGFQGTNQLWKWPLGGSIINSVAIVGATITSVANGVIASDDNYYTAYNNIVVRIGAGGSTFDDACLTLPAHLKITSICTYGTYLAIGACEKNSTSTGVSYVYIWDLVQEDPQEVLDWGEGSLQVLGNIEGKLCGISDKYIGSSLSVNYGSLVVRQWKGGDVTITKEIMVPAGVSNALKNFKVIKNNKLYFYAKLPTSSSTYNEGIFVVGRRDVNYEYAITLDQIHETATSFEGIWAAGNFWFIAHSGDGSVAKTDDSVAFTETSIYESQKFNGGDVSKPKEITGIALTYKPLPSGAKALLKYRVDAINATSSWITAFQDSATSSVAHEALCEEYNNEKAFSDGKEIEFRLESTGGAEITGLKFVLNTLDTQIN